MSSAYASSVPPPNDPDNGDVLCAIGAYIAAASFYFVVVFGADVVNRYVQGKPWYPNKYIQLNAISLTVLTVAIKFPTDVTTRMEASGEQFSKLTGSILVCIVIANTMPSLGGMDGASTVVANVGALLVTIVTLIVDLWIQIKTSIILKFWREQIVVMVVMFLQLLLLVSTALVVPTTKELMERQFQDKHNQQPEENISAEVREGENYVSKIKENIVRFWFMAHTSNPQYVVARSPTCIASGGLCLVTVGAMIVAIVRTFVDVVEDNPPIEKSGYNFSVVTTILFIQMFAIILGTIGPASRCMWWSEVVFKNCNFRTNWKESIKNIIINSDCFEVEAYWVSRLVKWKDAPFCMNLKGTLTRKIIRFFKWFVLTLLVKIQIVIVIVSKLIRAVSVVPMFLVHNILQLIFLRYFFLPAFIGIVVFLAITKHPYFLIYFSPYLLIFFMRYYLVRLKKKFQLDRLLVMDEHQHSNSSNYVLHLEGERGLESFITKDSLNNGRSDKKEKNAKVMQLMEKNKKLIQLIQSHSTLKEGFHFVTSFRANTTPSSHAGIPWCSWALPLVTLSAIAVALPGVKREDVKSLLKGVSRGLKFVRLIEQSIDDSLLINMREAAEFVWLEIDLDKKWLDFNLQTFIIHSEDKDARGVVEDLKKIATNLILGFKNRAEYVRTKEKDAREVVQNLRRIATKHILEFKNGAEEDAWNRPYEWPPMVLAAYCMRIVCTTILQNYDQYETKGELFKWLQKIISDILGACLTNIPEVIDMECSKKSIEVREEGVLNATNLFLETKDILKILYDDPVAVSKFSERKMHIEDWSSGGVIVATDMSATEDLSLHPEPSSATTQQLEHVVIEVNSTDGSILAV